MAKLYNDFIKNTRHERIIKDGYSQRESTFCSLLQFALLCDSQVTPDFGGMKTSTLRHTAERKGISLQFLLPQTLNSRGCPGDGRQAVRELSAQVLIEATSLNSWTSSFPGTWGTHLSLSKVRGASFSLVHSSGPLFLQEESQRKNFSPSWPRDINSKINNKVMTLLDMMPGIRCVPSKHIHSLLQDGFLLLYFKY